MSEQSQPQPEKRRRIRWSEEEKTALGTRLSEILHTEPYVSRLQAVDRAQEVLEPHRRRHLLAWSTVRTYLEPYMLSRGAVEARISGRQQGQAGVPNSGLSSLMLGRRNNFGLGSGLGSDSIEAAVIDALSQESIVAKLAELFAVALVRATDQIAQTTAAQTAAAPAIQRQGVSSPVSAAFNPRPAAAPSPITSGVGMSSFTAQPAEKDLPRRPQSHATAPRPKVLIVGVAPNDVAALSEALRGKIDLRFWRQGGSLEQLRLHASSCSVAVVINDTSDADTETVLRGTKLQIVRHSGGISRLKERLTEMQENGLFNLLMAY